MKFILAVGCIVLVLSSCTSSDNSKSSESLAIAKAYGSDHFDKVKTIEFTFNVQRDTLHTKRHWKWLRETNMITATDKGKTTSFKRYDTSTTELKELNAKFTNDEYWLLFPLHLKMDDGYTFTKNDTATAPLSGQKLHKYTVRYNDKDGFTPGDMYDLYTDDSNVIREWAFHKKASPEPSLITTWEDYRDLEGLKIAKEHKTKDGKFRLYFTDINVH
jgi:outer membrane lipoprotein-sorting protein